MEQYWDESEKSCINVCPCNQVYDKNTAKCVENNPFSKLSSKEQQRQLQHALKETAMAFYRKGDNIQYEDARRSMYIEPEVTTSQQVSYLTCSGFVHAVFRQALNIKLPLGSIQYGAYGHSFSNNKENKDIIYYLEGDNLKEVIEKAQTKNDLLEKIQPGDVIAYHQFHYDKEKKKTTANSGHVVYIYDLIKDNKGTTIDARILHSNSSFEYVDPPNDDHRTTKLSASLSWNNKEDDEENNKLNGNLIDTPTGVHEGTIQKTLSSKVLNYDSTKNSTQFVVMRPTNNPKSYKHIQVSNYKDEDYPKWATNTEITDIDYNITDAAYCRMKYHDIEIEKTLDVHPGSTVEPGQDLTYTIKIINHSDNNYDPIYITEELSEYVSLKDAGGGTLYEKTNDNNKDDKDKVAWYIPTIKAGETHETTYTVTVKNDPGLLGKVIKSNGAVAKIKSKEIVNTIAYNLCTQQIKKVKDNYELISQEGKLKGLEAIQETYKVLSYDIPLTGMKLGALYLQEGMKEKDFPEAFKGDTPQAPYYDKGKPHYDENKNEALLISRYQESNVQKALVLNTKHALAGMVLNHYYGGVSSTYSINQNKKVYTEKAAVKSYENSTGSQTRVDRQVQIYPETLRDGDILIYANTLDTITKEDGTYAYIFLDGKFQGVNSAVNAPKELAVKNGVAPKYFTEHKKAQVSMIERFGDMPKIFGKDFYVILRPALTMKTGCKDD
ncbi:MAG: hypothetical protein J6A01_05870 [Proteobacteria bacterium]|nr:hypothetical protein [Pseudomonadota bacterium]